jgi:hypothetical protein
MNDNGGGALGPSSLLWDEHGLIRVMAVASGWAMVRRPGRMPWVMTEREARKLLAEKARPEGGKHE